MKSKHATPFHVRPTDYRRAVKRLVRIALAEDIGSGDLTTSSLQLGRRTGSARLLARSTGILAGTMPFEESFRALDRRCRFTWTAREGQALHKNQTVVTVTGRADAILTAERTAINFLAHLSGVATATRRLVDRIASTRAQLLDTRKTIPGLRLLEKHATAVGGACNHRLGLYDALMLKDNHYAAAGGLREAMRRAKRSVGRRPIICEVRNLTEIPTALSEGATWLLLDNFTTAQLRRAVTTIREFERTNNRRVIIEASGGITTRTIAAVARTGVDLISTGQITHSAPAVDFSLEWT